VLNVKTTHEFFTRVAHEAALRTMTVSQFIRTALEQYMASNRMTAHTSTIGPGPRGAVRQEVRNLLREHPEGLTPVQIRLKLGIDRDLGSTVKAMARDGLLTRLAQGLYGVRQNN
jgi:hypothetical protein